MKFDANSLPDDPEQLKQMLLELQQRVNNELAEKDKALAAKDKELAEQESKYKSLLEQYNLKVAKLYGQSSEQLSGAGETFNEAEAESENVAEPNTQKADESDESTLVDADIELDETDIELLKTTDETARALNKPKRKPLPKQLPRKEVIVDLNEIDKVCDCCQSPLHKMGESTSEKLEFVPAHIKVIKTIRPKYACRQCEKTQTQTSIKQAPMPVTPIPKGIATSSLLSHVINCKYQYALPLYRQESWFGEIGIELSRKTMANWVMRCAEILTPLYNRLKQELLAQAVIHADETPLKVINAEKATSYMWVYCCGDDRLTNKTNIVLYDYHNSRAATCVTEFLGDYAGYLQVDGYQAYGKSQATIVGCLAHIRRKFYDAKQNQPKGNTGKADVALNLIGKLYGTEQRIKNKSIKEKYIIRQQEAKPIVEKLHAWLIKHEDKYPPKSSLGKAISYGLNQFAKFRRYLEDGRLNIDNNRAERAVKPFVIGRKNWLFSNTSNGAEASAILYSLVETAKANNLLVQEYLADCLQGIVENPEVLDPLLPWNR